MKHYFTSILFILISVAVCSQDVVKNSEYYLTKSKKQRNTGRVLLIGGPVLIGAGLLIGNRAESSFDDAGTGAVLGGVGVLMMLGSVPLFIASSKNKRKAAALSFNIEQLPQINKLSIAYKQIPVLTLKINL